MDSPVYMFLPGLVPPGGEIGTENRRPGGKDRPTCYVTMGFNKKTDFAAGRTLDLDKMYRYIIKPAAEGAGLACVRADDMIHLGLIDRAIFEHVLSADKDRTLHAGGRVHRAHRGATQGPGRAVIDLPLES